ncbi:unnamed protein product [Peniophora sp. CBMAI 1063]|nr:unnamed protein product [Peniophora sp. CBMAI 1063]
MHSERESVFKTTHNTAAANKRHIGAQDPRSLKQYERNPGPRDRLVTAAGPSRPRNGNARIQWAPSFRNDAAKRIWQKAEDKQQRLPDAPAGQEVDSADGQRRHNAPGVHPGLVNFAGVLDALQGDTRVDMLGVPVSDEYLVPGPAERTSQGKTQVDYMRNFAEENLAFRYAQLILVFNHAPPPDLRCSMCQTPQIGRWRCAHCCVKRDFCGSCLRQAHWNNPFHIVGWWTGQHYRRAWLRDAGVAINLCPNARPGERCPASIGSTPDFALADATPPPSYGSYSTAPIRRKPCEVTSDTPLTAAVNPDSTIHLPPHFNDIDDGEREDVVFDSAPRESDAFQPIGDDEDDESYASEMDMRGGIAREAGRSSIPTKDLYGHRTLVIVHTDGIHGVGVGFCKCDGHAPEDQQLIQHGGLYPASQDRPSTAFTLQFLEYRHIDDVVCKTSPQAHMKKLRRCTEPNDPRLAPNRYSEALVASRQFEAIKNLIDFGYATQPSESPKNPSPGGLVWQCIVCPRKTPNFNNLPKAWVNNPNEWRKFVSFCYDGNFSGDHTISRRPGNNVPLFPGTGMFDHPDVVRQHMAKAVDDNDLRKMDPTFGEDDRSCHNHRAAASVGKNRSKIVDIKGIGEGQHPVDKSLDSAFQHTITDQITRVQLLYDIWCRYGVHVKERFRHSGLNWPKFREVLQGVGVWHIYGHVFECLRRFSPSYSPRSGIVDGEILETLWSLLNAVLQSCRGMSLAAREEKINMHMNDINYRKIVGMVGTLVRKLRKYSQELDVRRHHLRRLELSCDEEDIVRWEQSRKDLEERRAKDPYYADEFWTAVAPEKVDAKTSIEVRLLEGDETNGLVKAIITSLKLEEDGLRMQAQGKTWGSSLSDRRTAAIARTRFNNRRLNANLELAHILGRDAPREEDLLAARLQKILDEDEWGGDDDVSHSYHLRDKVEFRPVDLPSARPSGWRKKDCISALEQRAMDIERELRQGDMEERLQAIREGVCDQAQGYRLEIRKKKGKGKSNYESRTNAWLHVRQQTKDVRVHAAVYNNHVRRLRRLMWDDTEDATTLYKDLRMRYRFIAPNDIRCSTETYETYNNIRTRGDFRLPWFWRMNIPCNPESPDDDEINTEHRPLDDATFIGDFYRTRWINARCAVVRCEEEEFMLQGEMQTCYLGYVALAYAWRRRARLASNFDADSERYTGHRAHALQVAHSWLDLAAHAKDSFNAEVLDIITDDLQ